MSKRKDLTISTVSRESGNPQSTVRLWADRGWLKCRRDSAKRRLFDDSAVAEAIRLRESRRAVS